MNQSPRVAQTGKQCVACGCCVPVCPRKAIRIKSGITASIDDALCIGCGRCAAACPAAVITILERKKNG